MKLAFSPFVAFVALVAVGSAAKMEEEKGKRHLGGYHHDYYWKKDTFIPFSEWHNWKKHSSSSDSWKKHSSSSDSWKKHSSSSDSWKKHSSSSDSWKKHSKSSDSWKKHSKSSDSWKKHSKSSDSWKKDSSDNWKHKDNYIHHWKKDSSDHWKDFYYDDDHYRGDWGKTDFYYKEKCTLTACIELYHDGDGRRELGGYDYDYWGPTYVDTYGVAELTFDGYSPKESWKYGADYWNTGYHHYDGTEFTFKYDLYGLEPKTKGKVTIRNDNRCEHISTDKKMLFVNQEVKGNPYKKMSYYADHYGDESGKYNIDNGYHCTENIGKTVYISMPNGGYGCGVLTQGPKNCKKHHKKYIAY